MAENLTATLVATRDIYGKTLAELGKTHNEIVVLDADLSASTKTSIFAKAFPERFFDMGVSEQDMIGTAAGLAACGKTVFASTFAVFGSGRAWDQIRVSIAYTMSNVKIVVTHGGITTGEDGATHQANEDLAIMRVIPNMTVIVPADGTETDLVIRALLKEHGPAYVRLSRLATPLVYKDAKYGFAIGKGVIMREGKDVSIIAAGTMVHLAVEAAEKLQAEGISARVVNMHTIKPIDRAMIEKCARETKAIVTAEEHSIVGGLGGAVSEIVCETYPVPVERVGTKDTFGESGKPSDLLEKYGLTTKDIVIAAKNAVKRK
jgi:transketolase